MRTVAKTVAPPVSPTASLRCPAATGGMPAGPWPPTFRAASASARRRGGTAEATRTGTDETCTPDSSGRASEKRSGNPGLALPHRATSGTRTGTTSGKEADARRRRHIREKQKPQVTASES
ncbi:hypothetical protein GCM10010446_25820 [Streptomyces enissocaesilis]|uniref:Uncharacterized protein n=1 Tax=Streptomyces enissocaesilis TaxID=332589 RepID=A0ABP6JN72_9ACTN